MRLRATALSSISHRALIIASGLPLDGLNAAAAYSLRQLRTAYTGPLVRVRRSSDNAEADIGFGADGWLDLDALTTHCQTPRRPLDAVTGAAAAYGLRLLRTAYAGPAIRVRRSSDNAESDIGFTAAGDLDTVALLAFTGAGSGFVTVWYDQSGNARNAVQATAANQPRIVNAGVVDTMGGRPTLRFDGANDVLTNASALIAGNTSYTFDVVYSSPQSATVVPFFTGTPNTGQGTGSGYNVSSNRYNAFIWASAESQSNPLAANTPIIQTARREAGVSLAGFVNGTAGSVSATPAANFAAGLSIGAAINQFYLSGPISEVVAFTSALSTTDRELLERSQAAYFGITYASPVSGFVTTWYDQSGNARNAAQATAVNQPRIVNAGVVDTINGKPAINFDGVNDFLELSSGILLDDNFTYVYSVLERATTGRNSVDVGRTTTPIGYGNWWFTDNVLYSNLRGNNFMAHGSSTATGTFINGLVRNNSGTQAYRNGTAFGAPQGAAVTGNVTLNAVGRAQGSSAAVHNGPMAEVIVGRAALSTDDRQALERNQGAAFGITVA